MNLVQTPNPNQRLSDEELEATAKIVMTIARLGHEVDFVPPVVQGPLVTAYKIRPKGKTKVSHIEGLAADIAIALGSESIFVKRLPGDVAISVFVPRRERKLLDWKQTFVGVADFMRLPTNDNHVPIPLNLGFDWLGRYYVEDLTQMPHLLVAGSTGSGKSTLMNSMLATIVYTMNSNAVQLVLSDTKGVEFSSFVGAPHLLFEPCTSVYQTLERMDWLIDRVEDRLKTFSRIAGVKNVHDYRKLGEANMPYILLVIDELADLMMHRGEKRGESKIATEKLAKIVQKSRAVGIYVVAATQRPSVNVVEGVIKANFPARLTFRLPSDHDSRTVLGQGGAEQLMAQGDMLFNNPNKPGLARLHAPYAQTTDIRGAVEAVSLRERQ